MFTSLRRFALLSAAALLVLGTLTTPSWAQGRFIHNTVHPDPGVPLYFYYPPRVSYGYSYSVTPLTPYGLGYNPYLYSGYNPYLYSGYSPYLYSGYNPYLYSGYNPYLYSGYSPYAYYGMPYGSAYSYYYRYRY